MMKKADMLRARAVRLDEAKKRTLDEQMQAIKGMSIDAFVRVLQRNEGGKYDKIFLQE